MKGWVKFMSLNDIVTVKAWWLKPVQNIQCRIVYFWNAEQKFIDVQPLEGEDMKIHVIRKEDISV